MNVQSSIILIYIFKNQTIICLIGNNIFQCKDTFLL